MRVEPGPPGGDTLREEKGTEEKTKLFLLRGRRGKSVVALRGMKKKVEEMMLRSGGGGGGRLEGREEEEKERLKLYEVEFARGKGGREEETIQSGWNGKRKE